LAAAPECGQISAVPFEPTAGRLWKRLAPEERLAAATFFSRDPAPEMLSSAVVAVAQARRMRPQAARALPPEAQARILATVLEPGEALASSLLVALHLGERRGLLSAFLDAAGLPHDDGILKEEGGPSRLPDAVARDAVKSIAGRFPGRQVEVYLNTLWLQDPERWDALLRL
jgi:hypothetical protein